MVAMMPASSPTLVNTTTKGFQENADITALDGGGFVVTWEEDADTKGADPYWEVRAQVYNAAGQKVGGEVKVNTNTSEQQWSPAVTALDGGGFAIVWNDFEAGTVSAQRFSAKGKKVGGEIDIADVDGFATPDIARLKGGGFVATWTNDEGSANDVFARMYKANGKAVDDRFLINDGDTTGNQGNPAIVSLDDGGFAIAYSTTSSSVGYRFFDKSGDKGLNGTFGFGTDSLGTPSIARRGDGIVISVANFTDERIEGFTVDSSDSDFLTIYDPTDKSLDPNGAALASLADGGFVAIVENDASGTPLLVGSLFDPDGFELPVYDPENNVAFDDGFTFPSGITDHTDPQVTVLKNGDIAVVFTDQTKAGNDSSNNAVRLQIFKAYQHQAFTGADETKSGTNGRDLLSGLGGVDKLSGLKGDDILIGGTFVDTLNGGSGKDFAGYLNASGPVTADLQNAGNRTGEASGDIYIGIENLMGSGGGDQLYGNAKANVLSGYFGNDTLQGRGGADFLDGGQGTDGAAYDDAKSGVTADLVTGGKVGDAKGDRYVAIENLFGSKFNDTLLGDSGSNTLSGGLGGDDKLYGRGGDDELIGAAGEDVLEGGEGGDILNGGGGPEIDTASYASAKAGVIALLSDSPGNTGEAKGDTYTSIENLLGSKYDDFLYGTLIENRLMGGAGNDVLAGLGGIKDVLDGGAGIDAACYDAGVGVTADLLNPGINTQNAFGDVYISIENLIGSSNGDALYGDNKANEIHGGDIGGGPNGADFLFGRGGNDVLKGGSDADTLDGGPGKDTYIGGIDADKFVFAKTSDTAVGKNRDIIQDYFSGEGDKIDLSAIDAKSGGGDDAFAWIDTAGFGKHKGELRYFLDDTLSAVVQGDVNGDGKADFEILVGGVSTLFGTEFIP